ncbi:DUF6993 domain-containing protein [Paenarthrobacter sp. NPDC089989]|uniref:DUF6993 domain-containing protein n=1 Tax=unclassified Paenarthrobacter TaxID=2634190 RepID=UPI0038189FC4
MAEWPCDEWGSAVIRQNGRSKRLGGVLLSWLVFAAALASCAPAQPSTNPAQPASSPAQPASNPAQQTTAQAVAPAVPPASTAAATTADPAVTATAQAVEITLRNLVSTTPKPSQEAVRAALVAAGIPKDNVEVSAGRTPTGLDVDAMEAAALTGSSCVMGQIRDGAVVVTVLPVLATGKCFIGDAR